jgi:hypothetical protein
MSNEIIRHPFSKNDVIRRLVLVIAIASISVAFWHTESSEAQENNTCDTLESVVEEAIEVDMLPDNFTLPPELSAQNCLQILVYGLNENTSNPEFSLWWDFEATLVLRDEENNVEYPLWTEGGYHLNEDFFLVTQNQDGGTVITLTETGQQLVSDGDLSASFSLGDGSIDLGDNCELIYDEENNIFNCDEITPGFSLTFYPTPTDTDN